MHDVVADPEIGEAQILGVPGRTRDRFRTSNAAVLRKVRTDTHRLPTLGVTRGCRTTPLSGLPSPCQSAERSGRTRFRVQNRGEIDVRRIVLAVVLTAVLFGAGCSSSSKSSSSSSSTTTAGAAATSTTIAAQKLRILVTNDDGVAAPGISALVEALRVLPDTEVTVIAPQKNQSGTGGKTSTGTLTGVPAKTAAGYAATAVEGYPADTIIYALDDGHYQGKPNVVISGINFGQNTGKLIDISGTVGAARAAAARGVPALAVSADLVKPDFPDSATAVVTWLAKNRTALAARDTTLTTPASVTNLNIPTCTGSKPKPVVVVPVDTTGANPLAAPDCTTPFPNPKTDVQAFLHGYEAQTNNLPAKYTGS